MPNTTISSFVGSFSDVVHMYNDTNEHTIKISNNLSSLGIISDSPVGKSTQSQIFYADVGNVNVLSRSALCECINLSAVVVSQTLYDIGEKCFYGCANLPSVTVKNRASGILEVQRLGDSCFKNCRSLVSVDISLKGITQQNTYEIGKEIFSGCSSLTNVNLHDNIYIREHQFTGCNNLSAIEFFTAENSTISLDKNSFAECPSLSVLRLPQIVSQYDDLSPSALGGSNILSLYLDGFKKDEIPNLTATVSSISLIAKDSSDQIQLGEVLELKYADFSWCATNGIPTILMYLGDGYPATPKYIDLFKSSVFKQSAANVPAVVFWTTSDNPEYILVTKDFPEITASGRGYPYFCWYWEKTPTEKYFSTAADSHYFVDDYVSNREKMSQSFAGVFNSITSTEMPCKGFNLISKVEYTEQTTYDTHDCWGIGHSCWVIPANGDPVFLQI